MASLMARFIDRSCLDGHVDRLPTTTSDSRQGIAADQVFSAAAITATGDHPPADGLALEPEAVVHGRLPSRQRLQRKNGTPVLFDWEGAGTGPRVASLGVLFYTWPVRAPWDPPARSKLE
jgi:hypothetical protein